MELLSLRKRLCKTVLTIAAILPVVSLPTADAADPMINHTQVFLDSLFINARIQSPRLGLAGSKTYLALPSLLQRWGIISSEAAATYNNLTRTLVLQPNMLVHDEERRQTRLASLKEIREATAVPARIAAGIIFHELSHAEYALFVGDREEQYDRDLLDVMNAELPAIIAANHLSFFKSIPLPSEIFAYHREGVISLVLEDVADIKLASGLDPDLDTCTRIKNRPSELRDFSPNADSYEKRAHLTYVFVAGTDVNLDLAPEASQRLNAALYNHMKATVRFPESRADIFRALSKDSRLKAALAKCLARI